MESLLGSSRRYVPKGPWRNGSRMMSSRATFTPRKARTATGHDRSPELQRLRVCMQLRTTGGMPHRKYQLLVAVLPCRNRLGKLLVIPMSQQSLGSIHKLKKCSFLGKLVGAPVPLKTRVRNFFIQYSLASFPSDYLCSILGLQCCQPLAPTEKAQHLQLEPRTSTRKRRSHRKTHCGEVAHHHPSRIN